MFKPKVGYFSGGFATGLILLFSFLTSLPDGKLHIIFCDVGQGDAAYIRFPDGRDMLVDGGPNNTVLECLGKHMPFWDRTLDIVVLTHPQNDHLQGLIGVFERYHIGYFVRSDVTNTTEGYQKLMELVRTLAIKQKLVTSGERISVGPASLVVIWPPADALQAPADLNDSSVVFRLRFGSFDALLPGDAPLRQDFVEQAVDMIEVLKVPHHGSRTGMSSAFLDWLKPSLAVISVGKNSYGHPAPELLQALADKHIQVLRTDTHDDIEVVSDGTHWMVTER